MFLRGNRFNRKETTPVKGTWNTRGGPTGVAGCFTWDAPEESIQTPEPTSLDGDQRFTNELNPSPLEKEGKIELDVGLRSEENKKDMDRDHIYVGNQKIYRTCKNPEVFTKRTVTNIVQDLEGPMEAEKERNIKFTDNRNTIKVTVRNNPTDSENNSYEETQRVENRFENLNIEGYALKNSVPNGTGGMKEKDIQRESPLEKNVWTSRPSSGESVTSNRRRSPSEISFQLHRTASEGMSSALSDYNTERSTNTTRVTKTARPGSQRYKMNVPWAETESTLRQSIYIQK